MLNPHKEIINGQEFWMLPVEGGAFLMGSADGEAGGHDDEKPQHKVTVPDFYIGKFPVTQKLWRAVVAAQGAALESNRADISLEPAPSGFQGEDRPVEQVSWGDAQVFVQYLNTLTESSRPKGHVYRLPTEAEWEYAARGGKYHLEGCKYAGSDRLKDVGWFELNSDNETKPVGLKNPNQLGIFDMSGNVWEWCKDDWHGNYYGAPKDGSAWIDHPNRGAARVLRGGSWLVEARSCRVAYRGNGGPGRRGDSIGFRLALAPQ